MLENYNDRKEIIYLISYAYFYVSVLVLIRKLVADNKVFVKYLTWIIRLEILKVLASILVLLKLHQAGILEAFFGLTLFVLYVILIVNIFNRKYTDKIEVLGLRPFITSLLLIFLIVMPLAAYAEYNRISDIYTTIYGIIQLFSMIPYVFLIGYFKKMKVNAEIEPTANNT